MTKINRPNLDVKAFASESQTGERYPFSKLTPSDDLTTNLNPEWNRGWAVGTDPVNSAPPMSWFNGQMFTSSQLVSYLFQMGISEWNFFQFYPQHARAIDTDGNIWVSKQDHSGQVQELGLYWKPASTEVTFDDIDTLRANTGAFQNQTANVLGYDTPGDGGGGPNRRWDEGKTPGFYTDNGGRFIVPGDGSAAWVWDAGITVDIRWYGATGDGVTDDTSAIQNCFDNEKDITAGEGTFNITGLSITYLTTRKFSGAGPGNTIFSYTGTGIAFDLASNRNPILQHFQIIKSGTIPAVGSRTGTGLRVFGDVGSGSSIQAYLNTIRIEGFARGIQTEGSFITSFNKMTMKRHDISYYLGADSNSSTVFNNCESNNSIKQHIVGVAGSGTCGATFNACEFENAEMFPYIDITGLSFLGFNDCYLYENNFGTFPGSQYFAVKLSGGGVFNFVGGGLNSSGLAEARIMQSRKLDGPYSMITITNAILSTNQNSNVLIDNDSISGLDVGMVSGCLVNNTGTVNALITGASPLSQLLVDGAIAPTTFSTVSFNGSTNDLRGNAGGTLMQAGASQNWENNCLIFQSASGGQTYFVWPDTTGKLRIKSGVKPASDTDGTVIGSQT